MAAPMHAAARRSFRLALLAIALAGLVSGEDQKKPETGLLIHIGKLTLRPSGFLDAIGVTRSASTPDSISTHLGSFPLTDTPTLTDGSLRNSRIMLKGELPAGPVKFSGYMESDFLNFTPGQSPYRWRQYWGQASIGNWEILGGQAWSFLRPNRLGLATDRDMFHTDVIDAAYHTGLLGFRPRQVRVIRNMGNYKAGVAWEEGGNLLAKIARDGGRTHLEATGLAGRSGRQGASAAGVIRATARLRLVAQQYWSKRALQEALNVVPQSASGLSTIDGAEYQLQKNLEVYFYGGVVYASRFAGNRVVRQWSLGANRKLDAPSLWGDFVLSLQYSHMDRDLWTGRSGAMDMVWYRVRYTFNHAREGIDPRAQGTDVKSGK